MPSPVLADTGTSGVSPPKSSMTTPASASSVLTRSGLASARSILFIAITSGTLAAFAWLMASSVWGMTPSSAATTITAMSVTRAPRARIEVNASWPGRVEEDDVLAVLGRDLGRADVLGDAAALARRDGRGADGVEQARLAVVDVAHDGHDRGAGDEVGVVLLLEQDLLGRLGGRPGAVLLVGRRRAASGSATS